MKLLTKNITNQLIANGKDCHPIGGQYYSEDMLPVVKLFTPDANCTWLLSEINPNYLDTAYGLCDLGLGFVEFGAVSLTELRSFRDSLGLPVERDFHFKANKPVSEYSKEAQNHGCIIA